MKGRKKEERTCLLLGLVEEQVHCTYVGEQSQRQRHPGDSRVDVIHLLSHIRRAGRGIEKREKGTRCSSQEGKGVGNEHVWII